MGSIVSSIFGFSISVLIGLYGLKKLDKDIYYGKSLKWFSKTVLSGLVMFFPVIIIVNNLSFDVSTISGSLITIVIGALVGAPIYLFVSHKLGLIEELLGKDFIDRILIKLHLRKRVN